MKTDSLPRWGVLGVEEGYVVWYRDFSEERSTEAFFVDNFRDLSPTIGYGISMALRATEFPHLEGLGLMEVDYIVRAVNHYRMLTSMSF